MEYKKHKITDDDWRNREKRDDYKMAVHDMIAKTSTEYSPWHIIPANSKNFARIAVLKIIKNSMKEALKKRKSRFNKNCPNLCKSSPLISGALTDKSFV